MERIPCEPNPSCKFYKNRSCYKNRHHIWFPKRDYKTPDEKRLREHPLNIEIICRAVHEEKHRREKPPEKPSPKEIKVMLRDRNMEHIRDKGKSPEAAARVQDIVQLLGQMTAQTVVPVVERTDYSQLNHTASTGYDSEGIYHFDE